MSACAQHVAEMLASEREHGPVKGDAIGLPAPPHRRQPVHARAARQPHKEGFGQIVLGMADGHIREAVPPRPARQQAVARAPRLIGEVAARGRPGPVQRVMRQPQPFAEPRHLRRLVRRLRAQPVIDGGHAQGRAARCAPVVQKMQERDRVAAARDRDAEPRGRGGLPKCARTAPREGAASRLTDSRAGPFPPLPRPPRRRSDSAARPVRA